MIHLLLDAARVGEAMTPAKTLNPDHLSLYKGRSEEALVDFAPYLFNFAGQTDFADWFFANGWGQSWGLFIDSVAPGPAVYQHLRQFLMIQTDAGKALYFRFYDPRVLRLFLPTCTPAQLQSLFGPIRCFMLEDEAPDTGLYFWLEAGTLQTGRVSRSELERAANGESLILPNAQSPG